MISKAVILKILLSLPTWIEFAHKESLEARTARMETVTTSMVTASEKVPWSRGRDQMVLALITEGHYESRFALFVHNNDCLKMRDYCDKGRAISPWQLQPKKDMSREVWLGLGGTGLESTTAAATVAAETLAGAWATCKTMEGAFSLYATGSTCNWSKARIRYRSMVKFEAQARKLMAEE